MKRKAAVLTTCGVLCLIGALLPLSRKSDAAHQPRSHTEEEWRLRHGQPTHWRACLLQQ